MRVYGWKALARNESDHGWEPPGAHHRPILTFLQMDLSKSMLGLTRKKVNYA